MKSGLQKQLDTNMFLKFSEKEFSILKTCFLWTFVWGFFAHGFAYANFLFNHDGLQIASNQQWEISLGRFMHPLYFFVRGTINAPWLVGVLSLCFLSVALFFICDVFRIEKSMGVFLLAGILTTNTTFIVLNATYLFLCDLHAFALLLTTFSIWIVVKRRDVVGVGLASVFLMAAMGIYQSFFSVWLVMAIVFTFTRAFEQECFCEGVNRGIKAFVTRHSYEISFSVVVVFACVLYKLGTVVSCKLAGVSFSQTFNYVESAVNFKGVNLLSLFVHTYKNFFITTLSLPSKYNGMLVKNFSYSLANVSKYLISFIYLSLFALLLHHTIKNRKKARIPQVLYCVFLLLVLPLAANCIYFLSKGIRANYELVHLSNWVLFVLPIIFYKKNIVKIKRLIEISFLILITVNVIVANNLYEKKKIVYDSTVLALNRMLTMVESDDDYVPGKTELLLSGSLNQNPYYSKTMLESVFPPHGKGRQMTGQDLDVAVSYPGTYYSFIKILLNSNANFYPYSQEYSDMLNAYALEIEQMPVFPKQGCCRMIDGRMFVKLSGEAKPYSL